MCACDSSVWDAIVIGSGIGGLAAAAALGKRGRKVLLLEQHSVLGGQTQTFRRGDWEFATGVHYIGGVGPHPGRDGQFGRLLGWLSDGALQFAPCTNPYDIVHLPGYEFGISHPESAYRSALMSRFPDEHRAIDRWFDACREARASAFASFAMRGLPNWIAGGVRLLRGSGTTAWANRTVADELSHIKNPRLRAILGARWGDYGAIPDQAPLAEHALVMGAYDGGAYYPVGGPARFAQSLLPAVLAAGGAYRVDASVKSILLRDGQVAGVEFLQGDVASTESTRHVISDIGATNTVACLPDSATVDWRAALAPLRPGPGFVCLYVGFEGDIATAGASSANHWIYEQDEIGRLWRSPSDEDAPALFVSFPSLKDPSWRGPHTGEVIALVDPDAFVAWMDPRHATARVGDSADYAATKEWIAARLLAQFGRHFPQLATMVKFHEAATPITQKRFTQIVGGSMYGLEMSGARLTSPALSTRTPITGLLLSGQDVTGPGIPAAFMAGMMAAAAVDPGVWREMGR